MYLLDTNILLEFYKLTNNQINQNVRAWLATVNPSETMISAVSLSEIQTGILLKARKDKIQAQYLTHWFEQKLIPIYRERTLPITANIALLGAQFHIPNKMNINDAYIAATAKQHKLVLVTRNIKDFEKLRLDLINPFD
ncbi:type II toxin-antitoxin system VapC family toxin [Rodentibacter heidelbergensis]|uniref:VapC toxin family PIN domain ribonuclease n=1 Tax=Rodentibacter heidelbergensis TaxID=1908258 RepID=A0A1V3I8I1_9PAST|nr:type II toxin-antitoxin system VapC family toxin [Rodentibacter heidelbergensis]OOF36389.1 VapC toxin family PIN domain ribonuclease [Rodentibacter heidelbergensis]